MKRALLVALMLTACGPAWRRTPVRGPDGTMSWHAIECRERSDCLALAGDACKKGYEITQDSGGRKKVSMLVHCTSGATASGLSSREPPQ